MIYIHGKDKCHRPFVVVNCHKLISLDLETSKNISSSEVGSETLNVTIFVMEWMKANLWFPGKVENFNMLIDLSDVGITQCPFSVLKAVLGCL